jgi:hypothetical protein
MPFPVITLNAVSLRKVAFLAAFKSLQDFTRTDDAVDQAAFEAGYVLTRNQRAEVMELTLQLIRQATTLPQTIGEQTIGEMCGPALSDKNLQR